MYFFLLIGFFYVNYFGSNIMLVGDMNVIVGCVVLREEVDICII